MSAPSAPIAAELRAQLAQVNEELAALTATKARIESELAANTLADAIAMNLCVGSIINAEYATLFKREDSDMRNLDSDHFMRPRKEFVVGVGWRWAVLSEGGPLYLFPPREVDAVCDGKHYYNVTILRNVQLVRGKPSRVTIEQDIYNPLA